MPALSVKDVRIYDLQHTSRRAPSRAVRACRDRKLLGHTQVQKTARYAHLAADPVEDAADRGSINKALRARSVPSLSEAIKFRVSLPSAVPVAANNTLEIRVTARFRWQL